MSFYTAVNCIDGRVQLPVINYLMSRFGVKYIDSVTEPGPNLILAKKDDDETIASIIKRIRISVDHHKSSGIAVVGHYDCAGNPAPCEDQAEHTCEAIKTIKEAFPDIDLLGLWVDENWEVSEV
ncbi:MAG: hypothetical protein HQK83_09815 [Fibrobacteria bacterium]|nr:hypothetical protein [Fibrobacteria bacterium]